MKSLNQNRGGARRLAAALAAFVVLALPASALAQCQIVTQAPKNRYQVSDDVQLGRQAVQEAERQLPIMNDREIEGYINNIGQRLVSSIPGEFQHQEFRYTFRVVNQRDINAFALPGGPMYVNRGMIEAARNEGEVAGVMAHEISHVALRHATAQATETQKYQIGSVLGQVLGGVIGGPAGAVIGAGSQIGFGAGALKYSRKYETQADVLGSQIMARAGYDPRDLANMFTTIARQGGGGGPEWMSSHPNPGNRNACINQIAQQLRVSPGAGRDNREFQNVQARLRGSGRAYTAEEVARGQAGGGQQYPNDTRYPNDNRNPNDNRYPNQNDTYARGDRVAYPSTNYQNVGNDLFRAQVPSNWRALGGEQTTMTYAPEGAYGSQGITHGVMFGTDREQDQDLQRASQQYINDLLRAAGNEYLRQSGGFSRTTLGGRQALYTTLSGRSPVTGRNETVTIVTTMLRGGDLFYMAAVTPQNESNVYQRVFSQIMRTLQINDRY
jgi:Zn-dependent protease with chaperone function